MPATLRARYTTDDASDTTPTWIDATSMVRAFNTSRGRDSELSRVEAGTASILLDNRQRTFDPTFNSLIRPMNRWWLEDTITGESVFFGYARSYTMGWPSAGKGDAFCRVELVDEFAVLALDRLPTTDPPRDSYSDLVMFDQPAAYWRMNEDSDARSRVGTIGPELVVEGASVGSLTEGAVVGANPDPFGAFYNVVSSYAIRRFEAGDNADPLVVAGLDEVTIECWFDTDDITPASTEFLIHGPTTGGSTSWRLYLNAAGTITFDARNSAGTPFAATSGVLTAGSPPTTPTWKHVVGTVQGGFVRLYIDGTQVASTAWTGPFHGTFNAGSSVYVSDLAPLSTYVFDEVAFYRFGLTAARITAHYNAGRLRGFARGDLPGPRITSVLTAAGSTAATSIQTGTREMTGSYMTGQSPLDEIRKAEAADSVDAMFFTAKDGTLTFLADGHRSSAPYNTVQATFDDDGTDLEYTDIAIDHSDSWIANEINVTRDGGAATSTSTDATSVSRYLTRPLSLTSLPIRDDADQSAIATALLAKYKDPMTRVTSITVNTARAAVATAVLGLDIGDRIRVFRTQLTGGRIDQTLFVQKIEVSATPGVPWTIRLGVSPL